MSWEAKARFLGLSWETVSRTSSGKFLRVESCYPESFGFLCLWIVCLSHFQGISKVFESPTVRRSACRSVWAADRRRRECVWGSWRQLADCPRWSETRKCSKICNFGSYLTVYSLKTPEDKRTVVTRWHSLRASVAKVEKTSSGVTLKNSNSLTWNTRIEIRWSTTHGVNIQLCNGILSIRWKTADTSLKYVLIVSQSE